MATPDCARACGRQVAEYGRRYCCQPCLWKEEGHSEQCDWRHGIGSAISAAWGDFLKTGRIRDWSQESAEVAFMAFMAGWNGKRK